MPAFIITRTRRDQETHLVKWRRTPADKWQQHLPSTIARQLHIPGPRGARRRDLERFAAQVARELDRQAHELERLQTVDVADVPLQVAAEQFVEHAEVHRKPRTAKDRRHHIAAFVEHLGAATLTATITSDLVRGYCSWQATRERRGPAGRKGGRLSAVAYNGNLRVIRAFLTFCSDRGWLTAGLDALRRAAPLARQPKPLKKTIPRPTLRRILAGALAHGQESIGCFVAVGACCPMRSGEILRMRWEEVHLADNDYGAHLVVPARSKTGVARRVPLWYAPELQAFLRAQRTHARGDAVVWSDRSDGPIGDIKKPWATVCKHAGAKGVRIKDLRSNAVSRLASWRRKGAVVVGAYDLARAAGHSVTVAESHYQNPLQTLESDFIEGELGIAGLLKSDS